MSKTATVHAQQKWEYMELTRKTEGFLLNDMNEFGQAGWELVSLLHHKSATSGLGDSACWTAFMKRPQSPSSSSPGNTTPQKAAAATPQPAEQPHEKPREPVSAADETGAGSGQSPEVFEFKD